MVQNTSLKLFTRTARRCIMVVPAKDLPTTSLRASCATFSIWSIIKHAASGGLLVPWQG